MSSHAATIRHYLSDEFDDYSDAFAALDALLAENQRLREIAKAAQAYKDAYARYETQTDSRNALFSALAARAAVGEE